MKSIRPTESGLNYIKRNYEYDKELRNLCRTIFPGSTNWIVCDAYDKEDYLRCRIIDEGEQKVVRGHNIVWFLVNGEWPDFELDHENGKPWDNSIDNLRPASRSQNVSNIDVRRTNKCHGVYRSNKRSNRWEFSVKIDGEQHRKYGYGSEFEAVIAREEFLDSLGNIHARRNNLFWIDGG